VNVKEFVLAQNLLILYQTVHILVRHVIYGAMHLSQNIVKPEKLEPFTDSTVDDLEMPQVRIN